MARGSGSYVLSSSGAIVQANGTSFSAPIMAGGVACLWQALPNKTNAEIMQLVRESASQYANPNYMMGYGIPNLKLALDAVLDTDTVSQLNFKIFPNPVKNRLYIDFPEQIELVVITIYDVLGKQILNATINDRSQGLNIENLPSGIYIARLEGGNQNSNTFKLIKH